MTTKADRRVELQGLAAAASGGDRSAFEALVVRTSPELYLLALRLVGNEHDARDVVQEAYLRAFRAIHAFRGEASVETWLYRIAANCSATQLRRRSRRGATPLEDAAQLPDLAAEATFLAVEDAVDERGRLVDALMSLPRGLRAVVVLRDVYGLDHEAIAVELGISKTAAKVRLHRARRRLREELYPVAARWTREPAGTSNASDVIVVIDPPSPRRPMSSRTDDVAVG